MLPDNILLHNRYRIEKMIGQGGMGAVYKARDEALRMTVAVKEALVSDKALLAAFEMEAIRLARLRHSALPRVTDHFVEGHGQYLVMEYIEGEDLAEMLAKRGQPFSVAEVLDWGDQLLAVLEYLHGQQPPIIHRDIKPPNLKRMVDNTLILLDFGLAKGGVTTIQTISGSVPGYTMGYAPLEQIRQGYQTDARTDLYAVAATLWTLLTVKLPVDAQVREQAAIHRLPDPLRPANESNPQVPLPIAQLLSQALALDAKYRPDSATTMRQQLQYEMQRAARERQQAEDARRQAELEQFRRQAEQERLRREQAEQQAAAARQQAQQEAETARRQAEQERLRREQAEQQAETARRTHQTTPSPQPATLSYPLVFGVIALVLLALIAGGVIANVIKRAPEPTAVAVAVPTEEPIATIATIATEAPPEEPAAAPKPPPEPTNTPQPTNTPISPTPIPPTLTPTTIQPTTPPSTEPIISEKDGMTLLYVPEGDFPMGSDDNDPDAQDDEKPRHTVFLDAYRIDQTPVTNAMFAKFLNERGNQEEGGVTWLEEDSSYALIENVNGTYQPKEGYANHPVIEVSWYGATAYCEWAGRRLPTEAEWEKAAGGTDSRKWPWGNEPPTGELANICDANCEISGNRNDSIDDGYARTSPVGNYPAGASPYGALDMAGNVWEWVNDSWDSSYYENSPNENPLGPTPSETKVLRGGSWSETPARVTATGAMRTTATTSGAFAAPAHIL